MPFVDLKIDEITGDYAFADRELNLVQGIEAVAQSHQIHFKTHEREWFLDLSAGVPYRGSIFVKSPDLQSIDSLMQEEILGRQHTTAISFFNSVFNPAQRTYLPTYRATTDEGTISVSAIPSTVAPWGFVLLYRNLGGIFNP